MRQEGLDAAIQLLAPIVPHVAAVLWQALGHAHDLTDAAWPEANAGALKRDEIDLVVQVNGRKRALIQVAATADQSACEDAAMEDSNVRRFTTGKTIRKIIVVPGKLVNVVVQN